MTFFGLRCLNGRSQRQHARSGDEPELDAFAHDAHPVFEFDALVPVPNHVLVEHFGEPVDGDAFEATHVEELFL